MRGPRLKFFANKQRLEQASHCFRCGAGFIFLSSMVATQCWLGQMSCNHTASVEYFSGRLPHCQSRNQSQAIFSRLLNSGNQTEYLKCRLSAKAFYGDPKARGCTGASLVGTYGSRVPPLYYVGRLVAAAELEVINYLRNEERARQEILPVDVNGRDFSEFAKDTAALYRPQRLLACAASVLHRSPLHVNCVAFFMRQTVPGVS